MSINYAVCQRWLTSNVFVRVNEIYFHAIFFIFFLYFVRNLFLAIDNKHTEASVCKSNCTSVIKSMDFFALYSHPINSIPRSDACGFLRVNAKLYLLLFSFRQLYLLNVYRYFEQDLVHLFSGWCSNCIWNLNG